MRKTNIEKMWRTIGRDGKVLKAKECKQVMDRQSAHSHVMVVVVVMASGEPRQTNCYSNKYSCQTQVANHTHTFPSSSTSSSIMLLSLHIAYSIATMNIIYGLGAVMLSSKQTVVIQSMATVNWIEHTHTHIFNKKPTLWQHGAMHTCQRLSAQMIRPG